MNDIDMILKNQRSFKNLKNNINNIIKYLNNAIESLETPSTKCSSYYNIDGIGIDKGQVNAVREELIKKRNYLKNIISMELDKEMKELENSIEGM